MHTLKQTISEHDYEMSCQFAEQMQQGDDVARAITRQSFSDIADREPKFVSRFPNLWNEMRNDIENLAIGQPLTRPVILAAGYTLDTALRFEEHTK